MDVDSLVDKDNGALRDKLIGLIDTVLSDNWAKSVGAYVLLLSQMDQHFIALDKQMHYEAYLQEKAGPCFVYFIQGGPYVKIGISIDPYGSRGNDLQVGNPFELEVLRTLEFASKEDAVDCERAYHDHFKKFHVRGEWFNITPLQCFEDLPLNYEIVLDYFACWLKLKSTQRWAQEMLSQIASAEQLLSCGVRIDPNQKAFFESRASVPIPPLPDTYLRELTANNFRGMDEKWAEIHSAEFHNQHINGASHG